MVDSVWSKLAVEPHRPDSELLCDPSREAGSRGLSSSLHAPPHLSSYFAEP